MQWHYIKKYMSQGVQFTWKVSYLFHKVHNFRTMPLYYLQVLVNNALTWQSSRVIANKVKLPYSLKLSRTKISMDFVVFGAPTKVLSLKISYKLVNPTNLYCMRFAIFFLLRIMNLFNTNYVQYRQYVTVMILGALPASKLYANHRWPLSKVSLAGEYSKGGLPQPANYVETDRGS